jgi:hypothetical protein
MAYIKEEPKVSYQSKEGKGEKVFDASEWLAAMCSHVPKGEQMVRNYVPSHDYVDKIISVFIKESRDTKKK